MKIVQFTIVLSLLFPNTLVGQRNILLNPEKENEVFKIVEEMPRFPGCEDLPTQAEKKSCADSKMLQYIYSNLKYPEEAIEKDVVGQVVLQFMIETDGFISDINIKREIGYGCGQAAIDVIESMNTLEEGWRPGYHRGKAVRVLYTLPIKFDVRNVSFEIGYSNDSIYQNIEDMPFFPSCPSEKNRKRRRSCGEAAMLQFVYKNIKTPLGAYDDTESRRVRAFFVVEKNGSISNIEVSGDTDNGVGEMVVEVIEKMNEMEDKWIPGSVDGQNVRTQYNLPINMRKE